MLVFSTPLVNELESIRYLVHAVVKKTFNPHIDIPSNTKHISAIERIKQNLFRVSDRTGFFVKQKNTLVDNSS